MGRMLEALKHIEDQGELVMPSWPIAVEPTATADQATHINHEIATEQEPLDPRYREVVGAVLSQLKVRDNVVLLVVGFRDDEARGGQLAPLYPVLAGQVDRGLVVVDANFYRPGLVDQFQSHPGDGLAEVLAGRTSFNDAVCETEYSGLYLLAGTGQQDPQSDNGTTTTLKRKHPTPFFPVDIAPLLTKMRNTHRLVVIDTMLETPKEMAAWAAICDATILVARLEVTPRRLIRRAIKTIQAGGSPILGCILLEP